MMRKIGPTPNSAYDVRCVQYNQLSESRSVTDLSHCFFTSGSTGKPKGVLIEHHALVKRQAWMAAEIPLTAGDSAVQKTDYTFGIMISEWELFWDLSTS